MQLQARRWPNESGKRQGAPLAAIAAIVAVVAVYGWWSLQQGPQAAPMDAEARLAALREARAASEQRADAAEPHQVPHAMTSRSAQIAAVPPPIEVPAAVVEPVPVAPTPALIDRAGTIEAGSTLDAALASLYIHSEAAKGVVKAYKTLRNPRKLRPGSRLFARFDDSNPLDAGALREIVIANAGGGEAVTIRRDMADESLRYVAEPGGLPGELVRRVLRCGMTGSLASSLTRCGHDDAMIAMVADVLGDRLDFEHDVQIGDELRVVFDELVAAGETVRIEAVRAVDYRGQNGRHTAIAFEGSESRGTFTPEGEGFGTFFLREPVAGARFTSGFGMRMHPILLQMRPHLGIDLAAPSGTPVRAVADGVVATVGRDGVAGRYIKLRHARGFGSDYLHLSRVDGSLRPGRSIVRGQVIGAVGTTGRSTAPHLHLGIRRHGAHVDPMTVRDEMQGGVSPKDRDAFAKLVAEMRALLDKVDARSGDAS